jgi:hypothetical protein
LIFDCFFIEDDDNKEEDDLVGVDFLEFEFEETAAEEKEGEGSGRERASKYFLALEHQNELIQYPKHIKQQNHFKTEKERKKPLLPLDSIG